MQPLDLSKLKGRYVVIDPPVRSIYASCDGSPDYYEERDWPFLITEAFERAFQSTNTTTSHSLGVEASEILGISGDLDAPANYFAPLTIRLSSQVCWDHLELWREPLS